MLMKARYWEKAINFLRAENIHFKFDTKFGCHSQKFSFNVKKFKKFDQLIEPASHGCTLIYSYLYSVWILIHLDIDRNFCTAQIRSISLTSFSFLFDRKRRT